MAIQVFERILTISDNPVPWIQMTSKTDQLKPIVREMLTQDPDALNGSIAEEAAKRIGKPVDGKEVSRVRNIIGLGANQAIEAEHLRRLLRAYRAGKDGLAFETIWD